MKRSDFTPLYMQFYHLLKEKITSCPAGTTLPSERTLCEMYNLDRTTVRKALGLLAEEKLIERKQGRGTIVLPKNKKNDPADSIVLFALYHECGLTDRLGEPFYAYSFDSLEEHLRRQNQYLIYSKLQHDQDLGSLCAQVGASSVILAGAMDESIVEQCTKLSLPVVTYNTWVKRFPAIVVDNENGITLAMEHLLQLGHRRIGFIHVPNYPNSQIRLRQAQHLINDVSGAHLFLAEGDWNETSGYIAAQTLMESEPRITAIFAGNDSMALGVMRALWKLGLHVPEDISVIGFDGIVQSNSAEFLTTVGIDFNTMAEAVCMMLSHMLQHGRMSSNIRLVISGDLVIHSSTGPAKRDCGRVEGTAGCAAVNGQIDKQHDKDRTLI